MVLGSHLGVPCGLDLKFQSLVIESFSVGSRAVLSTMGKVLAAAGSKSFMALGNNMCGGIYCRFWHASLNHLKQQHKALRQASQLCCFGLQMQFVTVF